MDNILPFFCKKCQARKDSVNASIHYLKVQKIKIRRAYLKRIREEKILRFIKGSTIRQDIYENYKNNVMLDSYYLVKKYALTPKFAAAHIKEMYEFIEDTFSYLPLSDQSPLLSDDRDFVDRCKELVPLLKKLREK